MGHDNQNEVQSDFFGHVIPLALASASHNPDGVVNGTITELHSL